MLWCLGKVTHREGKRSGILNELFIKFEVLNIDFGDKCKIFFWQFKQVESAMSASMSLEAVSAMTPLSLLAALTKICLVQTFSLTKTL
jgi:hypothetical protein